MLSQWQRFLTKQSPCTFAPVSLYIFKMSFFYRTTLLVPSAVFRDVLHSLNIHPRKVQTPGSMNSKDLSSSQFPAQSRVNGMSATHTPSLDMLLFYGYAIPSFTLRRIYRTQEKHTGQGAAAPGHRFISFSSFPVLGTAHSVAHSL